jgi:hypothetical protein
VPRKAARGGPNKTRLENAKEEILVSVIDELIFTELPATITEVYEEVSERIKEENDKIEDISLHLMPPSRSTVARRIQTIKQSRNFYQYDSKDESRKPARSVPEKALAVAEIDDTIIDLIAIDD